MIMAKIYMENKGIFEQYGVTQSHINMIKDMIDRSKDFVSMVVQLSNQYFIS